MFLSKKTPTNNINKSKNTQTKHKKILGGTLLSIQAGKTTKKNKLHIQLIMVTYTNRPIFSNQTAQLKLSKISPPKYNLNKNNTSIGTNLTKKMICKNVAIQRMWKEACLRDSAARRYPNQTYWYDVELIHQTNQGNGGIYHRIVNSQQNISQLPLSNQSQGSLHHRISMQEIFNLPCLL